MGLKDIVFGPEYRSGENDLSRELYRPGLLSCKIYWRAAGYFSSSVFEAIGQPLEDFIKTGGQMRLVTSVELTENDVNAIHEGLNKRKIYEDRIMGILDGEFSVSAGKGSALLAKLLEAGRLDIKIATPSSGKGIYHEKVGLFLDGDDYVAFFGSSNETKSGLEVNYECVDVYTSWGDSKRANSKKLHFERLWSGAAKGVDVFDFSDAAKNKLIRICKSRQPGQFESEKQENTNKWRHQQEAIEAFLKRKRGVLEMATGTGKTRTALKICQHLISNDNVATILISADGNDLLDQWYKQILELTRTVPGKWSVFRHYESNHQRERISLDPTNKILLASRQALPLAMKSLREDDLKKTFLIHDEVHKLGSPANRKNLKGLSDAIPYRLGLSATPEREYDQEGNQFIESHIGETIFEFGLKDAIKRGILCPFNYYPLEYTPSQEDRDKLKKVHSMVAARKHAGNPMSKEDVWMEIARVYKTSEAKFDPFASFIEENQNLLERCIIFVETMEYGEKVLDMVHKYRHDFHTYFGGEEPGVLGKFARGELECLLTCHRLSEGIDIQSINSVLLFSSSKAKLESIQRIGRSLRIHAKDPQKRANVVDFIRNNNDGDTNADIERRDWLLELAKVELEE